MADSILNTGGEGAAAAGAGAGDAGGDAAAATAAAAAAAAAQAGTGVKDGGDAGAGTGGAGTPQPGQWRDSLPDDMKADPSIQTYNTPADMVKAHTELQRKMGEESNKIILPDKHGTDADWTKVFHKLGLPESSDKYEIDVPEGSDFEDDFVKEFINTAHAANILPKQAQALLNWYQKKTTEQGNSLDVTATQNREQSQKFLKDHFGMAYAQQMALAQSAVRELSGDRYEQAQKVFNKSAVGDEPELILMLARAGKILQEAGVVGDLIPNMGMSPNDAQKSYKEITDNKAHPYWDKNHPGHTSAVEEVQKLFEWMHGKPA